MSSIYLGQILMFGGNFAPRGYALCNGQILSISQNAALFALLGTSYGGNGQSTFALPNLQSQVPIHMGQGAGLSPYNIGQAGGSSTVTVLTTQMPSHTHTMSATTGGATTQTIANNELSGVPNNNRNYYTKPVNGQPPPTVVAFAPQTGSLTGGSQPHSNLMPSLCITFIIALQGIFPSRN